MRRHGCQVSKTSVLRKSVLQIPKNRLAILCGPNGILLHPENACIVIDLELD
jgi:hypothetical protein